MKLFPFFIDIEDKDILIVGGGTVASEKYSRLSRYTDRITVIARECEIEGDRIILKEFEDRDLEGYDVVIAATSDRSLNERIVTLCQQKHILVNVVDAPDLCTFIFPSLIKTDYISIGITSSGKSPLVSQYLRREIEKILPDRIDEFVDSLYEMRLRLKDTVPDQEKRAEMLREKFGEMLSEYEKDCTGNQGQ